jgi:hypothetical protein
MDIAAYRKQCQAEISRARSGKPGTSGQPAASAKAAARGEARGVRVAAATESAVRRRARAGTASMPLSLDPEHLDRSIRDALQLLGDPNAKPQRRLEALLFLQSATFNPPAFAPHEATHDAALQRAATDSDKTLREAALEQLSMQSHPYAHRLLRDGLTRKIKPLVNDAKAVQLLGMDAHGATRSMLRKLAVDGIGKVREEAIRSLGNDPKSAALLARVGADRSEKPKLRQLASLSLKSAAPQRFAVFAKRVALDESEQDRLRATALSAIAHTAPVRETVMKAPFTKKLDKLAAKKLSAPMKKSLSALKAAEAGSVESPTRRHNLTAATARAARKSGKRLRPAGS